MGVVFAVMRERSDRTLRDPGDASHYLGLSELGIIPDCELELTETGLKNRPKPKGGNGSGNGHLPNVDLVPERRELISWERKASIVTEAFRTTLTSILFSNQKVSRPRVLVLTSASPKEGKTTVSCNLATALAEIGHRVLVIDADMRRPQLHRVFDLNNELGLGNILLQRTQLEAIQLQNAIQPTIVPGLFVLTSGTGRQSVSSLLHSERLGELIAMARGRFDTVVIDTPPMVNIADARILARYADAVILVLRSAATTRDAALEAKSKFTEDGMPIFGTILNGWNPKTPGYGYYAYYYSAYYHYYNQRSENKSEANVKQT